MVEVNSGSSLISCFVSLQSGHFSLLTGPHNYKTFYSEKLSCLGKIKYLRLHASYI